MSIDPVSALAAIANAASKDEPHLSGGLSSHFSCLLKQVFQKVYGKDIQEDQGAFIRGKEFHRYIQALIPMGTLVDGTYLVIGHEQIVRYPDASWLPRGRLSPIDTLVFNVKSQEYEIWDWKTTRVDLQYVKNDPTYEAQANLYAQLKKGEWNLPYDPMCRILTVNAADWSVFKGWNFRSSPKLFAESAEKIRVVNQNAEQINKQGLDKLPLEGARALADGLNHWSQTKQQYRKDCRYCDFKERCVSLIKAKCAPDEIDTAEVVI